MAGLWAGAIATYMSIPDYDQTADITIHQGQGTAGLLDRLRAQGNNRTQPYVDPAAPTVVDPSAEAFDFPQPILPPALTDLIPAIPAIPGLTAPPVPPAESAEDNPITSSLGSLSRLLNGEGGLQDIIKLAIAAFAIFGGAQFGGSDMLFKMVLGLFSSKANFNGILEERLKRNGGGVLRRRRARK